jgi:Acyl-CoA dehydrogenase, middle domain
MPHRPLSTSHLEISSSLLSSPLLPSILFSSLLFYSIPFPQGDIRSCFAMTEPDVASSDATNMESTVSREGNGGGGGGEVVLSGSKWWTSGAMDPRCKVHQVEI